MGMVQDDILERIRRQGRGKVFIPRNFLDLGSREGGGWVILPREGTGAVLQGTSQSSSRRPGMLR